MRKKMVGGLAALAVAGLAALGATAPAQAASSGSGDTTVTFTLSGGGLSISTPATADLGTYSTSATTVSGSLGNVTVDDSRGQVAATWTVNATATDFKTGGGTTAETIPATDVTYTPGLTTGTAVTVPTPGLLGGALPLPVVTATGVGNNTATWNPTLTIALPLQGAVAGQYTGTITQSVS